MEIWENRQLIDLEGELWLPIKGYEGLYEISNMGRVKSLPRITKTKIIKSYEKSTHVIGSGFPDGFGSRM